ncbi:MAG: sigma-54-dependent Fis family transcriptional regulator, partial [Acidobacteria bacterium]|nr:sigma-54-dependent Fis family transcriptional regulator [Acidobacteriota bacterium]
MSENRLRSLVRLPFRMAPTHQGVPMSHLELTRIEFGLWRAFQSEGSSSLPAHPVFDRWRRVQRLGVRPEGSPESQELLRGGDLRARQERSAALMGAASEVLPASESVFDDAHYSLLLTDEKGLILRSQAGGEFGGTARKLHLIEGGRWSEEVQGTNAIGTALVEERPVAVAGCAHFVRSNHALICYASPIRDPYGRIVGVLDATSHAEAAHPAIQLAVLHGARAIQEALRSRAWASAGERGVGSVLRQSDAPAFLVEWPGVIMASNATAERTLPVPLVGSSLEQVCGLGWEALVAQVGRGLDRLEVPRWGPGGRPRQVALHPVEGPPGMILGVVVVVEPATDRTLSVTARKPVPSVAAGATSPFASLLGSDPVMRRTKELAARIAPSNLPVLLLAETGTGKGLLARAIHNASGRGRGPLMDINCGALSPQLLESELFGYAPGAFTGAKRSGHEGKIHHAAGGTLFLDEVAEMSPSLQVMLLKVLEEGVYYRVGENQPRRSDFRLIAATCRDLDGLVADGTFRRDLYYRIRGATLTLPTLRERSDL